MLSRYERRARVPPGLLGIAPITFAVVSLGLKQYPAVAILAGVLTTAGGTYVLSILVGRAGFRVQTGLWDEWGGRSTLQYLRTRGDAGNKTQRHIWRNGVSRMTGIVLLTESEEARDENAADDTINAAVGQVLYLGQGGSESDPIVNAHNAQYGLERNLFGFRWWGRFIAAAMIGVLAVALKLPWELSTPSVVTAIVINAGFLIFWLFVPNKNRTQSAGDRYAEKLLDAVARRTGGS